MRFHHIYKLRLTIPPLLPRCVAPRPKFVSFNGPLTCVLVPLAFYGATICFVLRERYFSVLELDRLCVQYRRPASRVCCRRRGSLEAGVIDCSGKLAVRACIILVLTLVI